MQRGFRGVDTVEIAHDALDTGMCGFVEQIPVELSVMVPFALLGDFSPHEQKLLPRMSPHETEIGAQIRKALPAITGHLAEQRALAVHHLVMRERKDEVLRERV